MTREPETPTPLSVRGAHQQHPYPPGQLLKVTGLVACPPSTSIARRLLRHLIVAGVSCSGCLSGCGKRAQQQHPPTRPRRSTLPRETRQIRLRDHGGKRRVSVAPASVRPIDKAGQRVAGRVHSRSNHPDFHARQGVPVGTSAPLAERVQRKGPCRRVASLSCKGTLRASLTGTRRGMLRLEQIAATRGG